MILAPVHHIKIEETSFGERAFVGQRVAVEQVAYAYLNGSRVEWIAENFYLEPAQVFAALSYYHDHQAALDAQMAEAIAMAQALGKPL